MSFLCYSMLVHKHTGKPLFLFVQHIVLFFVCSETVTVFADSPVKETLSRTTGLFATFRTALAVGTTSLCSNNSQYTFKSLAQVIEVWAEV